MSLLQTGNEMKTNLFVGNNFQPDKQYKQVNLQTTLTYSGKLGLF
jgi:hypothetical protein